MRLVEDGFSVADPNQGGDIVVRVWRTSEQNLNILVETSAGIRSRKVHFGKGEGEQAEFQLLHAALDLVRGAREELATLVPSVPPPVENTRAVGARLGGALMWSGSSTGVMVNGDTELRLGPLRLTRDSWRISRWACRANCTSSSGERWQVRVSARARWPPGWPCQGASCAGTPAGITAVYRSVGPGNVVPLAAGESDALVIAGTLATFASGLPARIGVGDVILYSADGSLGPSQIAFIAGRTSANYFQVQAANGGTPVATSVPDNTGPFFAPTYR